MTAEVAATATEDLSISESETEKIRYAFRSCDSNVDGLGSR